MKSAAIIAQISVLTVLCWIGTTSNAGAQTNARPRGTVATQTAKAEPTKTQSQRPLPFRGTIKSVDKTAGSLVIGTRTFALTPKSKITEGGKTVELSERLVGQWVTGSYLRTEESKLPVLSMYVGGKNASGAAEKAKSKTPRQVKQPAAAGSK